MGVLFLPFVISPLVAAFWFREVDVLLPFNDKPVNLWQFLVSDEPQPFGILSLENFALWFVIYSVAWIVLYVEPQRSLLRPFKLNPHFPAPGLMATEFVRSARGVLIATLFECGINNLHAAGSLPTQWSPTAMAIPGEGAVAVSASTCIVAALVLYIWGDTHFYWSHRLLHTPFLYRNVHKEHHKSHNPDPWSGLSMHWFESSVYFSAAPIVAPFLPLWIFRCLLKGLIILPLEGHHGYGSWSMESSYNHYVHHSKFNWNYGSTPLWDHICGTNFDDAKVDKERARMAEEQARLAGGVMSEGMRTATALTTAASN